MFKLSSYFRDSLQWRHNGRDGVSNHQPHHCLLNRLFRRRSKKTSKLRVTGLCAGNSPVTVECPAQVASNEENVSISWRHHVLGSFLVVAYPNGNVHYDIISPAKIGSWREKQTPAGIRFVFVVTHSNFSDTFVVKMRNLFHNEPCSLSNVKILSARSMQTNKNLQMWPC